MADFKRKLIQISPYSLAVTLPHEICEDLKIGKGDDLYINYDALSKNIFLSKNKLQILNKRLDERAQQVEKTVNFPPPDENKEVKLSDPPSRSESTTPANQEDLDPLLPL